jgi:hypothetical protein
VILIEVDKHFTYCFYTVISLSSFELGKSLIEL